MLPWHLLQERTKKTARKRNEQNYQGFPFAFFFFWFWFYFSFFFCFNIFASTCFNRKCFGVQGWFCLINKNPQTFPLGYFLQLKKKLSTCSQLLCVREKFLPPTPPQHFLQVILGSKEQHLRRP